LLFAASNSFRQRATNICARAVANSDDFDNNNFNNNDAGDIANSQCRRVDAGDN
jgi:hypothetical protein